MAEETDRFQRWQRITIEQFGYALNLFLTYAVAALGYWLSLLRDETFNPTAEGQWWVQWSLYLLIAATAAGVLRVLNRLSDFRGTAARVRGKPNAPSKNRLDLQGRLSWWLFWTLVIGVGLGTTFLARAVILTEAGRLWP